MLAQRGAHSPETLCSDKLRSSFRTWLKLELKLLILV